MRVPTLDELDASGIVVRMEALVDAPDFGALFEMADSVVVDM